jgi:toxin ParE1/3/4
MAERLLGAIEQATNFLLEMPEAGSMREFADARARGIRSWTIHGFDAYLNFYRPREDGIEIIRVLHVARDLSTVLWDSE